MSASSSTELKFHISMSSASAIYVDTLAIMSRLNQRLYRQGQLVHIDVRALPTSGPDNTLAVTRLPNTWYVRKAWSLAKKKWWESTADERANGIKPGRWNDFRVLWGAGHTPSNSVTTAFGHTPLANGEVNYTLGRKPDGSDDRLFQFNDASAFGAPGRFGMIYEYDTLADTDQNTPAFTSGQMPYGELLTELSDQQANQIRAEGDSPPYDAVNVTGNHINIQTSIRAGSQCDRTGFMPTPCGLLVLQPASAEGAFAEITFKAGKQKGIHAEVMG